MITRRRPQLPACAKVYFRSDDYLLTDMDRAKRLQLRQQAQADLHQQMDAKNAQKASLGPRELRWSGISWQWLDRHRTSARIPCTAGLRSVRAPHMLHKSGGSTKAAGCKWAMQRGFRVNEVMRTSGSRGGSGA